MTLLLTGATGTLARALLDSGRHRAHRVRALARRIPPATPHGDVEWRSVDLLTGAGLDEALAGIDVVLHAASAPRGESERTEVEGTRRLLEAVTRAGVKHFLYVSIVGVDRIPLDYYRHKLAAEALVRQATIPWTIVRGTQFFELVDIWARALARCRVAPAGWVIQPIHAAEFALALWDRIELGPARHAPDVAGPEVLDWPRLVREWQRSRGRRAPIVALPVPGRLSRALREGAACSPAHATGVLRWADWLNRRYGPGG